MIIPIRTEMLIRRTPLANYAIIAVNALAFVVFNMLAGGRLGAFRNEHLILQSDWPALHQFFTYQFVHADGWHIAGNMLFLWVFGNSVNAKLGDLAYALFYLAGGVFAALAFTVGSSDRLLGASGSIAAVTTAYLVLFPRSHVTVMFMFFFITFFEVPAMILIGIKIILWDNIVAPSIHGGGNVAFEAHLGGYVFGFAAATAMLLLRAVPRDHFDMLSLLDRWNRRRVFRAVMSTPQGRRCAEYGTVAKPIAHAPADRQVEEELLDRISDLRARIAECVERSDAGAAATLYEELTSVESGQCLQAGQQLIVAREFYATGRWPQAAGAFEQYLNCYRMGFETDEIRLLVGIIYARDLKQYAAAEKHLSACVEKLKDGDRRRQCREWLQVARQALGRPATNA